MPRFGQPGGQRNAERAGVMYISTFRDPRTEARFLWENPSVTWYSFPEHYDRTLVTGQDRNGKERQGLSYPCVSSLSEFTACVGCTMPVEDEYETDPDEKQKDYGWRVRRISRRFITPTLNEKGYVTLRKVSGTFRDSMQAYYDEKHTIVANDYIIVRTGEGFDTKFNAMPTGEVYERKLTAEMRQLYAACVEGMTAPAHTPAYDNGWAQWSAGNRSLGVPDFDELVGQKYAEALQLYAVAPEELERRLKIRATAQEAMGEETQAYSDAPAVAAPPVAASAPSAATATVETADMSQTAELGVLAKHLSDWGVPYPLDATLEQMRLLHSSFAPKAAEPVAAQVPAPVAAAPVQEPVAQAPAPAPEVQMPAFKTWPSGQVREWLTSHQVQWDNTMPRHKLIALATEAVLNGAAPF